MKLVRMLLLSIVVIAYTSVFADDPEVPTQERSTWSQLSIPGKFLAVYMIVGTPLVESLVSTANSYFLTPDQYATYQDLTTLAYLERPEDEGSNPFTPFAIEAWNSIRKKFSPSPEQ